MTHEEFKELWASLTDEQKQRVRDKSRWEFMSLWAVLNQWPDLLEVK